jgi:thymidine kinase
MKVARKTLLVGSVSIVGATAFIVSYKNSQDKFNSIFNFQFTNQQPKCYDRIAFKQELNRTISRANPSGIIFVCGRMNAGKTTTIKSALIDRKHVAYVNWREKAISNEKQLNESLKEAFQIKNFKDYWNKISFGWLLKFFLNAFLPRLDYSNTEMEELTQTMNEIETILKFAQKESSFSLGPDDKTRIANRPVIFIDEIGALQGLLSSSAAPSSLSFSSSLPSAATPVTSLEVAKKFILWLIKISKDEMLCDIIFASHDGFTMELLNLADPIYCSSLVIPGFSLDDMKILEKEFPMSFDTISGQTKQQHAELMRLIINEVHGHAGHVLKLLEANSLLKMKSYLNEMKTAERLVYQQAIREAKSSCKKYHYLGSRDFCNGDDCYEKEEMEKVLSLFLSDTRSDPEFPLETVLRETGLDQRVIQLLVKRRILFYNPHSHSIQLRNKLFVDVVREMNNKQIAITSLLKEIQFYDHILDNQEFAMDIQTFAKDGKAVALKTLSMIESGQSITSSPPPSSPSANKENKFFFFNKTKAKEETQ